MYPLAAVAPSEPAGSAATDVFDRPRAEREAAEQGDVLHRQTDRSKGFHCIEAGRFVARQPPVSVYRLASHGVCEQALPRGWMPHPGDLR